MQPKWRSLVVDSGYCENNRAIWIKMSESPRTSGEGGDLGVKCIYASNMPMERMASWDVLGANGPMDCRWIVGGDFNMVEGREAETSLSRKLMSR